ncbi:hypothetical protein ACWDBO_31645 [Streptomyces mirabilis]|jgi:hypothetical protein|uniref:hypothetical protein n=1 Tax=Streptomyces mirabilis TaxID=68239 RepID=UPI00332D3494
MTGMRLYWLLWLAVGFVVPETYWLFVNTKNTLSWTIWGWFGVREGVPVWQWSVAHLLLAVILVWLLGHLAFGIWR